MKILVSVTVILLGMVPLNEIKSSTNPETVEETMGWGNFYYNSTNANPRNGWTVLAWSQPDNELFMSLQEIAQQLTLSE